MIQATRKNKVTIMLQSPKHTLLADITDEQGGDDLGMSPHEILEAALAACTSMTLQLYANRKSWPLESCDVLVKIVSETSEATVIEAELSLKGPLDDDQKKRLLEIAGRCPIHKLLTGKVVINEKLV
jgi:putative redox protein